MNAVLEKPRLAKRTKAAPQAPADPLAAINASIGEAMKKLEMVHHALVATDLGEPAELLVRALIDNWLPSAFAPLAYKPLTKPDLEQCYEAMFVPLAALEGAIALTKGTLPETTLQEALSLLDRANTEMTEPALLEQFPEGEESQEPQAEQQEEKPRLIAPRIQEITDTLGTITEAMWTAAMASATERTWGAVYVAEMARDNLVAALEQGDEDAFLPEVARIGVSITVIEAALEVEDDSVLRVCSMGLQRLKDRLAAEVDR
ncbi:hypothetical protein [Variovorax sp. DAIF25]|uniref:hypothetical protein n=1 Tax=Variovorax sp. DAIF25 TaxID=3080983 RepID=UPI003D6BF8D3